MRLREQRQTLEALSEVSRALASALSLPEFFYLAIRATANAFGAFRGNIWRYDPARRQAWIEAAYDIPPDQVKQVNHQFEDTEWSRRTPTVQAIETKQVVRVSDLMRDERFPEIRPWGETWGFRSAVYVPLIYGNQAIGNFSLYFPEPQAFDESDVRFLETVAAQVATAMVANDRLGALEQANQELEHRREELEMLNSQSTQFRLLQSIIEELPVSILLLDDELRIRMANPAALRRFGASLKQVQDLPITSLASAESTELEGILRRVIATREPFHADNFSFTLRAHPEFGPQYRDMTCLPMRSIVGDFEGVLMLSVDVTERHAYLEGIKRQVRELKALDEMKDNFLAIVSHELRTPLNFITGFASILEDEVMGCLTPDQHSYLQRILEGADQLCEIITNMLTFNRLQSGKVTLYPEVLDIDIFIQDLVARLQPRAKEKQLTLTSELQADLPPVCVDAESLDRVLNQLVDNALKFTPAGGRVSVRGCRAEAGMVRLEVVDTGIGIAESVLPKLFTRFFQADMSATRQFGGTGLGLAIAKLLVGLLHGEIGVESQLGRGSTFWFTLPEARGECR